MQNFNILNFKLLRFQNLQNFKNFYIPKLRELILNLSFEN